MRNVLSKKADQFSESVIREMSRICAEVGGVNLAQGFPDHDPPEDIKQAAQEAISQGYNQYAVTWGAPAFRQAIAEKYARFYQMILEPDRNITVTCGATEAMICSLMATVNPGDEVIIFEPFYENYGPDCILSGAKPVFVSLKWDGSQFSFDPDDLKKAFSKNTKALILNTPNNPLGKVFSIRELEIIRDLCVANDVLVITDEIYEHILYDDHRHIPIATLEGMADRTLTISGCSKTYSVTGWRLAYIIASSEITLGLRKVHDFLTVGAPHPLQIAGAYMMNLGDDYYQNLQADFETRRKQLWDALQGAGFNCRKPQGAYYILTNIENFLDKKLKNDIDFCMWMAKEVGVAAVPGSSFYHQKTLGAKQVRFTFSKSPETLSKAAQRLEQIQKKH